VFCRKKEVIQIWNDDKIFGLTIHTKLKIAVNYIKSLCIVMTIHIRHKLLSRDQSLQLLLISVLIQNTPQPWLICERGIMPCQSV